MLPAIFLDRDGVIIENRTNYIRSREDIQFLPGSLDALKRVGRKLYKLVIVTNQSVVGRGGITLDEAGGINDYVVSVIEQNGGRIDGVFMCPHAPDDRCDCRKPEPGLFLTAAEALTLDLKRSILIGDALTDLLAGQAAGVPSLALVKTGRGKEQEILASRIKNLYYHSYRNLQEALLDLVP